MAETTNQQIADALTEQHLRDARVETQVRREAWAVLALLEAEILAALKANDPTEFALLARRRRAVADLMADEIDPLIQARYRQLAQMLDDAMMRLATQEAKVVQQVINEAADDEETIAALPSERRLRAGVVHGLFPSPAKPTDLSTTGRDWWQRQADGLSQRLGDQLMVSVSLEETLTQASTRIKGTSENAFTDGVMAKARDDAARLVRTQTTNAVGEARAAVAEQNAAQLMLQHSSILDSSTSTICISRHGLKYSADVDHTPIGHSIPYLTGVPYHPNCVIGSTRVFATGIQGTSQREYIGEVVTIRTQRGYELTCTPNHPILTNQGWVAAHELDIGSRLVCCRWQERAIDLIDMNGQDRPSCIQDIVEAFQQTSRCTPVPVPVAAEDFHGDGMGSKIAIIGTNSLLGNSWNSTVMQPLMELRFQRLQYAFSLQCLCFLLQRFFSNRLPATCNIRRVCSLLSLLRRQSSDLFSFLLALCSERNSMCFQTYSNNARSDIIALPDRDDTHATCIGSNNLLIWQYFASWLNSYAHFFESFEQHTLSDSILKRNTSEAIASKIVCDHIVDRNIHRFEGHVYNLQTVSGWYVSNNIITHNCRSSMLTVLKNGGPVTDETLSAWLRRRGPAFQDAVLGPTRARMWREGRLSPRALIDASTGKPLTLEELGA